jgi:predicted SAM-dependent methyltransferase
MKLMKNKKSINLHLGCGGRNIPGFINVDLADFPHIHHRQPISDLSFTKNNSVDLVYSSHAFEYFDREEAVLVLKEWGRALKKGGILRLAVPDFEAMVKVYLKYGKDLNHKGILGPLFGMWHIPGTKKTIYHRTTYDFKSLKKLLEDNGFKNVKRYDWKKTIHKRYDDYSRAYIPHMDVKKGILISLNIEAIKK